MDQILIGFYTIDKYNLGFQVFIMESTDVITFKSSLNEYSSK